MLKVVCYIAVLVLIALLAKGCVFIPMGIMAIGGITNAIADHQRSVECERAPDRCQNRAARESTETLE